jgi:signal transduction histidine kinase
MPLIRVEPNKTLALTRVNILLERIFSVAVTLIGLQIFSNAIAELDRHPLNPFWFWLNFGLIATANLLILFLVWFRRDGRVGFAALTLVTVFAIVTWSFQLGGGALSPGEQPWIWWAVGIAGISSVGGFGVFFSGFFLAILPTMWFLLQVSDIGTAVDPWVALQDASFSFLCSSVLAGFVWVLRYEASRVDAANEQANLAAIELARIDAVARERDRVDALVHDLVLTTLLLAANASDSASEKAAEESAVNALNKLSNTEDLASLDESISINSLFSALENAIHRQSQNIQIESEGSTNFALPSRVASAITEATLQALANAINHAGQGVTIQVFLKGSADGLKIVVKDNGRGFRPSRVPKNRIGLRLSIVGRVQAVGGKVFIDSKIGVGTNVIIEWSAL